MTDAILDHDRSVLLAMSPRLDALWKPLRFLADLEQIWYELEDAERTEIEQSRPYRDQFHRRLAEGHVNELRRLADKLHSPDHRELRDALRQFLDRWELQEPDQVRVLAALVRRAAD
jgi:hypothetical protein